MQQAYEQANQVVTIAQNQAQEIMDQATNDANQIRMNAISYTDQMLSAMEDLLTQSQSIFKTNFAHTVKRGMPRFTRYVCQRSVPE